MLKTALLVLILALTMIGCNKNDTPTDLSTISIIPKPTAMTAGAGHFELTKDSKIYSRGELEAQYLQQELKRSTGIDLEITPYTDEATDGIILQLTTEETEDSGSEAYTIDVTTAKVMINASTTAGLFYGIQTLLQLMPVEVYSPEVANNVDWIVPAVHIEDNPRFKWRGYMLDVSRHFFTVEDIKKNIDWLSQHKMNRFHWHLIDDQGWRIEIKKYPELTEKAAWRVDNEDKDWGARPAQKEGEKTTYGGYYTQEQIREVVKYAAERHITVVPEIEMPAHVTCMFAAYPELSCQGKELTVPSGGLWPITDIYCAGNDKTFEFIEDVMKEVVALFPSEYIHIGGDEADKREWDDCPKCQARMRKENLKDSHELQSYFISRVEKILNGLGRNLIGWDEILEGGLAPNATVMSWRGMGGGIKAAKSKHNVVMTPTSHCYFDYYQGPRELEPQAFNADLPIKRVYSFNPVPEELTAEEAKYILGGQANLWTEQVQTSEHQQYMTYPRIAALAEAVWTPLENKDWNNFSDRLLVQMRRYDLQGINYARSAFNVTPKSKFDPATKNITVKLDAECIIGDIHYTTDGSDPTDNSPIYKDPFKLTKSCVVKCAQFSNGEQLSLTNSSDFFVHLATAKPVTYITKYSDKYKGQEANTLNNSTLGSSSFSDGEWQAWFGEDMIISIDLESKKEISTIIAGHFHDAGSWIFLPTKIEYFTSDDGKEWSRAGEVNNDYDIKGKSTIKRYKLELATPIKARYVKVISSILKEAPEWHTGAGKPVWLFADEVVVE